MLHNKLKIINGRTYIDCIPHGQLSAARCMAMYVSAPFVSTSKNNKVLILNEKIISKHNYLLLSSFLIIPRHFKCGILHSIATFFVSWRLFMKVSSISLAGVLSMWRYFLRFMFFFKFKAIIACLKPFQRRLVARVRAHFYCRIRWFVGF